MLDWGFYTGAVDLNAVGLALLYLSVFFAITSAGEYISCSSQAVEAKEKREREKPPSGRGSLRFYGLSRVSMRGNGIVSRTWGRPQIHATVRSMPRPKPACGNVP